MNLTNDNNTAVSMPDAVVPLPNAFPGRPKDNPFAPKKIRQAKPNYFEKYERKTTGGLLLVSIIYGLLYALCFFGRDVLPQLSFTIFCYATMLLLHFTLKALGLIQNRRAYVWYVPIAVISLFNSIYYQYTYTYLNIIMVHALFAVFAINVTTNQPLAADVVDYIGRVISVITGNWLAFVRLIDKTVRGKETSGKERETFIKIIAGILIAIPFLIVIALLLTSSDIVFSRVLEIIWRNITTWNERTIQYVLTVCVVSVYSVGYIYNLMKYRQKPIEVQKMKGVDSIVSMSFLSCLNMLFLAFAIVQFTFVFTGGLMRLPNDLVYSEYVRQGFFQLLFVTVINFLVILFFVALTDSPAKSEWVNRLLVLLCIMTGVLIASSFYRMFMYTRAYGFTPLRLNVITFLSMETVLIALTIAYLRNFQLRYAKYFVITVLVFYIIGNIAGSNPVWLWLNNFSIPAENPALHWQNWTLIKTWL